MNRVLIIDDDDELRRMAVRALAFHGYDVLDAANGRTGLAKARAFAPDIVLSDVHMVGMDGYDFVQSIRADPALAAIPVVLMTGTADLAGLRRGMSLGADDYLPKPFGMSELVGAVARRLARRDETTRQAGERLEQLRQNVVSLLPHELLTPIAGIVGVAQLLQLDADTLAPGDIRTYASLLDDSAERLRRLVANALLYASLEACRQDPSRVASLLHAEPAAAEVVRLRALEEARRVERTGDLVCAVDEATVGLARESLGTLVGELVRNALQWSAPGSEVVVRLAALPEGGATLTIIDRGTGFPDGYEARLGAFVQFERRRHEQQGLGLGLQICRRLVELVGGRFEIESKAGSGTCITIGLPGAS